MLVEVKYDKHVGTHTLYVVKGRGPSLLGRECLKEIQLDWASIRSVSCSQSACISLIQSYADVFQEGLGTMTHIRAHLTLKEGTSPRFCRPHAVPFALKDTVGRELDQLEEIGTLRKVECSEWAAPIMPVPKKDGCICLCGDYKVIINLSLLVDQYPLPNPTNLMASLAGSRSSRNLIRHLHTIRCYLMTSDQNLSLSTHTKAYTSI